MQHNGRPVRRATDGKFQTGSAPGPGRPKGAARRVAIPAGGERAYLVAVAEACSLDDWRAIVRSAVKRAVAGDAAARSWLSSLLLGANPPPLRKALESVGEEPEGGEPEGGDPGGGDA